MQMHNPLQLPAPSTTINDVIFFSSINASAVAANSPGAIVFGSFVIASPAVRSITSFPASRAVAANLRR